MSFSPLTSFCLLLDVSLQGEFENTESTFLEKIAKNRRTQRPLWRQVQVAVAASRRRMIRCERMPLEPPASCYVLYFHIYIHTTGKGVWV
jgi:hypothetical protein